MSKSVLKIINKYSVPAPERKYGLWWALGSLVLLFTAGNSWIAGVALLQDHWIIALVMAIPVSLGIGYASLRLGEHAKRLLIPLAEEALKNDERKPVLYLRPFGIDRKFEVGEFENVAATVGGPSFFATRSRVEDCLELLNAVGPLIAVGKPGELPQTGAYRLYIADDQWQKAISDLLPQAELVVVSWGESGGIHWELQEVLRQVEMHAILFYLPFGDDKQLAPFRETLQNQFKCKVPERKGNAYFLGFTADDEPFLADPGELGIRKNDPHAARTASLKSALKRLYPDSKEDPRAIAKPIKLTVLTSISMIFIIITVATLFYTLIKNVVPWYMPLAKVIITCITKQLPL
jgi:hypothetical protein